MTSLLRSQRADVRSGCRGCWRWAELVSPSSLIPALPCLTPDLHRRDHEGADRLGHLDQPLFPSPPPDPRRSHPRQSPDTCCVRQIGASFGEASAAVSRESTQRRALLDRSRQRARQPPARALRSQRNDRSNQHIHAPMTEPAADGLTVRVTSCPVAAEPLRTRNISPRMQPKSS